MRENTSNFKYSAFGHHWAALSRQTNSACTQTQALMHMKDSLRRCLLWLHDLQNNYFCGCLESAKNARASQSIGSLGFQRNGRCTVRGAGGYAIAWL